MGTAVEGSEGRMPVWKRILASLLRILAGVPIVVLWAGGVLYLVLSVTLVGRCVGLSAAVFGSVLFCSVGYWKRPWFQRIRRRFYATLLPLGVLLLLTGMAVAPSGGASEARVRNCFVGESGRFVRYSPWNIIPEVDQLTVGLSVAPLALPEVDSAEAGRIESLVLPLYDKMDQDDDFRELGSVMGLAYRDLCHLEFRTGHYYAVLPDASKDRRLPCLVFLHGMGGNIKACLWVLAELSRRGKCAVIAPTFGMGDWDKPGGAELVVDVVREAIAAFPLDRGRIFLMGYSNGGMGVTRAAMEAPHLFQGLIYLSPVTEDELFSTPEFLSHVSDRRVLFLQGGRDKRIPRGVVEGTVALLKRLGGKVQLKVYNDEDHYLLFRSGKPCSVRSRSS